MDSRLQIPIDAPPLRPRERLERLSGRELSRVLLGALPAEGADPALIPHQAGGAKEIALDHEAVEVRHALVGLGATENDGVADGRATVGNRGDDQPFPQPLSDL